LIAEFLEFYRIDICINPLPVMNRLTEKNFSYKCPMNWEEMQVSANGRFCNQCQKEVFDMTNCSIEDLLALQQKHGSICGSIRLMGAAAVAASLTMAACKDESSSPNAGKREDPPKEQVASVPVEPPKQAEPPQQQPVPVIDVEKVNPPRMMGVMCVRPPNQPEPVPPSEPAPAGDQ
jgi:hypothetical protein